VAAIAIAGCTAATSYLPAAHQQAASKSHSPAKAEGSQPSGGASPVTPSPVPSLSPAGARCDPSSASPVPRPTASASPVPSVRPCTPSSLPPSPVAFPTSGQPSPTVSPSPSSTG
jgi:hypothetical protein